jgi:hypothetical protein
MRINKSLFSRLRKPEQGSNFFVKSRKAKLQKRTYKTGTKGQFDKDKNKKTKNYSLVL